MIQLATIAAAVLAAVLAIQDLRSRQISVLLIAMLFVLTFITVCLQLPVKQVFFNVIINESLLLVQLLLLSLYFSVKNKAFVNIIDSYLGWGDILFWVAISPIFTPTIFFVQYLLGLLLAVFIYVPFKLLKPTINKEIPLVAASAFVFIAFLIGNLIFDVPLNDENYLFVMLNSMSILK